MKKIILTFAFLLSITYSFAAPVMPSVGTNTYYYIRFKSYGYVLQDNGANSILTCQILIPGNLSQFWKVDNGVTAGTYILTSGNGRKMYFNTSNSRYIASESNETEINFTTSTDDKYELGRTSISNKMNALGGSAGSQIGEWTLGDGGNKLEFLYAPTLSTSTSYTYYNIKFSRGTYFKDAGLNINIAQANLVTNAADQLWRIVATSPGSTSFYLVSKNGNRLCYNGSRYKAQKDGNEFSFQATTNLTYPNRWELARTGGLRLNDVSNADITDYNANDGGNPIEFSFVETLNSKGVLLNEINIATTIKNAAVVGTAPGQYAQASVDNLTTACATAQTIYDEISSTETDYQNATTNLLSAIDTFYSTTIYPVTLSTASSPTWYYIEGAIGNPNGAGKAITLDPATLKGIWSTKSTTANQMFRFERIANSPKIKIVNLLAPNGSLLFSKSPNSSSQVWYNASTIESWDISQLTYTSGTNNGNQYSISSNGIMLHLAAAGSQLVNYTGGYNSASALTFTTISNTDVTTANNNVMSILTSAINTANTNITAYNGANPGQISSTSVNSTFQTAINNATTIKNKTNPVATNSEISTACVDLATAQATYLSTTVNPIKYSNTNGSSTTWYAIRSAYYPNDRGYLKDNGIGAVATGINYSVYDMSLLWKIVDTGSSKINLVSKANGGHLVNQTSDSQNTLLSTTAQSRTITSLGLAQYAINSDVSGGRQVHLDAGRNIVGWNSVVNSGSAWKLEEVTLTTIIAAAENSYNLGGVNPGQYYPSASKTTYRTAIDNAIAVKNNLSSTQAQIDAAMNNLSSASNTFIASLSGTKNSYITSTTNNDTWYYIVSGNSSYSNNKVMVDNNTGTNKINWTTKSISDSQYWRFVSGSGDSVRIQNKATQKYISAVVDWGAVTLGSTPKNFKITSLGSDQFNIKSNGAQPLHAAAANSEVVSWSGGLNSASAWKLEIAPVVAANQNISVYPENSSIKVLNGAHLVVNASASLNNIEIEKDGKLTNNSGRTLNISSLTINSDANGTGTFVDNGTTTISTAVVKQYITSGRNWYMSAPISLQSSTDINTVFSGVATSVQYWDEPNGEWATVNGLTTLEPLRGYISVGTQTTGTVNFSGSLMNGNKSITLTRTSGKRKEGFHLIGNPYPSYLNAMAAINAANEDPEHPGQYLENIEPTIWYRTRSTEETPKYYFETVNTTSGLGTNASNTGSVTGYIPPMQAFWVRTNVNNTVLNFTNNMRYHAGNVSTDLGEVPTTPLKSPRSNNLLIRLQLSNGESNDETILYTNANATDGLDKYDSKKMRNTSASMPEMYTAVNSEALVINGMNSFPYDNEISLALKTSASTSLSIKATETKNIDSNLKLILLDKFEKTEFDLSFGDAYHFVSDAVDTDARFSLILKSKETTTLIDDKTNKTDILVYANDQQQLIIQFNNPNTTNCSLSAFNALGQKCIEKQITNTSTQAIENLQPGMYLVYLNTNNAHYSYKVIVK